MKLYLIEGRDKHCRWHVCRTLDGIAMAYTTEVDLNRAWAELFKKHIGSAFLEKQEQRYRVRMSDLPYRVGNRGAKYVKA